jgi:hypothetical protein
MPQNDVRPRLIFTAQSKLHFYCRDAVCEYVFLNGGVPLNPFRLFDYFLSDRVSRDSVRDANRAIAARSDEIWVFGETLADGVLEEIELAHTLNIPLCYLSIATRADDIRRLDVGDLQFEPELIMAAGNDIESLRRVVRGESPLKSVLQSE